MEQPSTWIGSPYLLQIHDRSFIPTIAYMRDPTIALYGTPSISLCKVLNSSSKIVATISNSHWMKFWPVYILPCWNTSRPPWCSFFGSWWWYGLLYSSQIPFLGNNATFWYRWCQIPSRVLIWVISIGLHCLPIWSNIEDCHEQILTCFFLTYNVWSAWFLQKFSLMKNKTIQWYHTLSNCLSLYNTLLSLHTMCFFSSCTNPSGWPMYTSTSNIS